MSRSLLCSVVALTALAAITASGAGVGNAASDTMVTRAVTPLTADAASTTKLGALMPGALLAVKAAGSPTHVTLTGWYQGTASSILLTQPGERITVARLTAAGVSAAASAGTKTDAYGAVWHEVSIDGFVDQKQLVADEDTVFKEASALYGTRCSSCHSLHQSTEYTANQWPGVVASMQQKAGIADDEAAVILMYLQRHAKQP